VVSGTTENLSELGVTSFGPSAGTRRSLTDEYRWSGLSASDSAVFASFLKLVGGDVDELHTHVPVGGVVEAPLGCEFGGCGVMVAALYPRRVDAAVRVGSGWWLIECKPGRGMHGLGQLLSYFFWWVRDCASCPVSRLVLVCEECDDDQRAVYECFGIDVCVV
jgi:hypothetical protein